ncbi:MAG: hypothetical protein HY711_01015 [Candidatus Melainabacteria bacterium]|nr:hypothetical protein [Candidatus Melainabacteria bacterium]
MSKLTNWIKQLLRGIFPTNSTSAWDAYRLTRKQIVIEAPVETHSHSVVVELHRPSRAS